jgi:hypothetical protein
MLTLPALLLGPVLFLAQPTGLEDTLIPQPVRRPPSCPVHAGATNRSGVAPCTGGVPFGAVRLMRAGADPGVLDLSSEAGNAKTIVARINAARKLGMRVMLAMTGGAHSLYMSTIDGVPQFDRAKWDAQLLTFNTPAIRDAVGKAVADGTVIGAIVMDEPYVSGGPEGGGNTWGPRGTMSKARVDSLCAAVHRIFPTLPAGVGHQHQLFEPTKRYRDCQFIVDQYESRYGDVTAWRDAGLAMARRDGHAVLFAFNVLNGGDQDRDGTWDCAGTGGRGSHAPNCRMTADQVRRFGLALGPSGCGLLMWRYDRSFWEQADNQAAFRAVADSLARVPCRSCSRS